MTTYWNAIIRTDYGASITYKNVTNPAWFVERMLQQYSIEVIFFYVKRHRKDKHGDLDLFWNPRAGLRRYIPKRKPS